MHTHDHGRTDARTDARAHTHTCRKSRWKISGGRMFHAIVSVMAVKIQLSSPMIVLRLLSCPGICSSSAWSTCASVRVCVSACLSCVHAYLHACYSSSSCSTGLHCVCCVHACMPRVHGWLDIYTQLYTYMYTSVCVYKCTPDRTSWQGLHGRGPKHLEFLGFRVSGACRLPGRRTAHALSLYV